MTEHEVPIEQRITRTLRAKVAQLPVVTLDLDAAVLADVTPPHRTTRSRTLVAVTIALVVVLVAAAVVLALRDGDGDSGSRTPAGDPNGPVVAHLRLVWSPALRLQATDLTTVAGVNEITFVPGGGTEALEFEDPALAAFRVSNVPRGTNVGRVDLQPGRDYRIRSVIPGHDDAGVHAVIHVLPTTAPGNPPLPKAVLDLVSQESHGASGPMHGIAQYALANRDAATRALMQDGVFDQRPVYVFVLHGRFVDDHASVPFGSSSPPSGTTLVFLVSQGPAPQVLDFGISSSVPDLSTVGGAITTRY